MLWQYVSSVVTQEDSSPHAQHSSLHLPKLVPKVAFRDLMQIIVGASLLAIPVGLTEEVWILAYNLPWLNVLFLGLLSLFFISLFIYYTYYRIHGGLQKHKVEFFKRVVITYCFSFLVVALLLILIQQAPFFTDMWLAFKRTIIVSYPASMSAAVADTIH